MQLRLIFLLITASIFLFSACSDDEGETYSKTDFYGTWKLSNSTSDDYTACPDNTPELVVTETTLAIPIIDVASGCEFGNSEIDYEFNGSAFVVNFFGQSLNYKITSYSSNEFKWRNDIEGETETWARVN